MKKTLIYLLSISVVFLAGCSKKEYYSFKTGSSKSKYEIKTKQKKQEALATTHTQEIKNTSNVEEAFASKEGQSVSEEVAVAVTSKKASNLAETLEEVSGQKLTKIQKLAVKKLERKAAPATGRSQLVAAILCWFLGVIGVHRFYLGYTTIGILQILTLGGCGIWALIDLIRILIGDLKPMDAEYEQTFDDL